MTGAMVGWGVAESACIAGPVWVTQSDAALRVSADLSSVMLGLFYLLDTVTVTVLGDRK